MKKLAAILLAATIGCLIHFGTATSQENQNPDTIMRSWDNQSSFLPPYRPNAYGPGVHSDAAGQAFQYQTQDGQIPAEPLRLRHNALGPGIHMDQYGRTVKPKPYK